MNTTPTHDPATVAHFAMTPRGPFSLSQQNAYFGGWLTKDNSDDDQPVGIVMAFPVEGGTTSAAVIVRQSADRVTGEVILSAPPATHDQVEAIQARAWHQALEALSLDEDGTGWPEVGQRDPFIGQLQARYQFLRPVLFHSPYEAAAAFIIGHRISIRQARVIRAAMARAYGDKLTVGDVEQYAFPRPEVLRTLTEFTSLSEEKIARLHGVAEAALAGLLDRTTLRAMPVEEALAKLQTIKGVGSFFSQGILMRGAGIVDTLTDDDTTKQAVQAAYHLPTLPGRAALLEQAENWRPFRMWTCVQLHVWFRGEMGGPRRPKR